MIISNKEDRFIQSAVEQAQLSPCLMRHGCVAVRNGRIVGKGFNNYRCKSKDGFIKNCMTSWWKCRFCDKSTSRGNKKRFHQKSLHVVRLDSKNELQESAPCMDCMNLIQGLHIKRVYHSTNGGNITMCQPCDYQTNHVTTGKKLLINISM